MSNCFGPILLRAVEHHVLEEMRDSGRAGPLVARPDLVEQVHRDIGNVVIFFDDHLHPVGERVGADRARIDRGEQGREDRRSAAACLMGVKVPPIRTYAAMRRFRNDDIRELLNTPTIECDELVTIDTANSPFRFAIAATFTAEPLRPVISFWGSATQRQFRHSLRALQPDRANASGSGKRTRSEYPRRERRAGAP